jgi:hypothetical protein
MPQQSKQQQTSSQTQTNAEYYEKIKEYITHLYTTYDIPKIKKQFEVLIKDKKVNKVISVFDKYDCRVFKKEKDPVEVLRQFAIVQDIMYNDGKAESRETNDDLLDDYIEVCILLNGKGIIDFESKNNNNSKTQLKNLRSELVHDAWAIARILEYPRDDEATAKHTSVTANTDFNDLYNNNVKLLYKFGDKNVVLQGRHFFLMVKFENLSESEKTKDTVPMKVFDYYKNYIDELKDSFPSPYQPTFNKGGKPKKTVKTPSKKRATLAR